MMLLFSEICLGFKGLEDLVEGFARDGGDCFAGCFGVLGEDAEVHAVLGESSLRFIHIIYEEFFDRQYKYT